MQAWAHDDYVTLYTFFIIYVHVCIRLRLMIMPTRVSPTTFVPSTMMHPSVTGILENLKNDEPPKMSRK